MNFDKFEKYHQPIQFIKTHKPKLIVEYGGGQSTYIIDKLLDELDYGGKIIAFEDNKIFFDEANDKGWNYKNSIQLVESIGYTENIAGKNVNVVKYIHEYTDILNAEFVIIDGPDLRRFDPYPESTMNLKELVDLTGKEIPFWVDGRRGTQHMYYNRLKYKTGINNE